MLLAGCAPAHDVESLFRDLQSNDGETRQEANDTVDALVRDGDYKVFLRGIDNQNPIYRAESIVILARMTQPEARRALRELLRVEKRMMLPYNPIRMKASSELNDSRILVAHLIARTAKDPEAVDVLLQGVDQQQPADVVTGTCLALGALEDPKAIPFLAETSKSRDVDVARAAVQALSRFQQPEVVAALKELIAHPAPEVRSDVLTALSGRQGEATIDLLEKMGSSDPSPELRASAIRALMQTGGLALTPYLVDRLRAGDEETRTAALEALHKVTGRSLGPRPQAWSAWWSQNQAGAASVR